MLLIPEGLSARGGLALENIRNILIRGGLPPVLAAQVLRMLDDGVLKEAAGDLGPEVGEEGQRLLLRGLQERYPEALAALNARLPEPPG